MHKTDLDTRITDDADDAFMAMAEDMLDRFGDVLADAQDYIVINDGLYVYPVHHDDLPRHIDERAFADMDKSERQAFRESIGLAGDVSLGSDDCENLSDALVAHGCAEWGIA